MSSLAGVGGEPIVPAGAERRWPAIGPAEHAAVEHVLDGGETWGPNAEQVTRLQEEWAEYVGSRHCLLVNSGTAALHCALVGAGVRPGDEVIVPAFSFVATAMAVLHAGAIPVFCDIDPVTFNIDPSRAGELVTARTRAVLPVHAHGLPADMDELRALTARHGLALVEDAAQAHGAAYRGARTGTLGDGAAFSLNGSKHLSAGEGGLYVTDDEKAFVAARRLAIFGEDTPPLEPNQYRAYRSHRVGWNYRSHELTAALARVGVRRLDGFIVQAERNARLLDEALAELPGLYAPAVPGDRTCTYYRYRIRIDPDALGFAGPPRELRDRLLWFLRAESVPASLWQLQPLPSQPVFPRDDPDRYPNAGRMLESSIVIGTCARPLWVQPERVVRLYVDAFRKVLADLDTVRTAAYEPVQPWPPPT